MSDHFLEAGGGRYINHRKLSCFTCCLNGDVAVVDKRLNETYYLGFNILNLVDTKVGNIAVEETDLVDGDNALVGNDPFVEIKTRPNAKELEPYHQKPERSEEKNNLRVYGR